MRNALLSMFAAVALAGLALIVGASRCQGQEPTALTLAENGTTAYAIVMGADPIPAEQTAAKELCEYLKKVTGAEFKVATESAAVKPAKAIYLGWTTFAASKGIDGARLGPEEWVVKTFGDDIVISGGRPRGTVNATYEFLEWRVGVHWLDPVTEVIPSRPTLEMAAPEMNGRPTFPLYRHVVTQGGFFFDGNDSAERSSFAARFWDFNNMDPGYIDDPLTGRYRKLGWHPNFAHTFGALIDPDEYAKDHPEYFSLCRKADGTLYRNTDGRGTKNSWFSLCLSSPAGRGIVIEKLRGAIRADRENAAKRGLPAPTIYDVSPNDCAPVGCLCPDCQTIIAREEADSGLLIDFINEIADRLRSDFPDILLQTFAYMDTEKAPKRIRPRDNVLIRWCDYYTGPEASELTVPLTNERNRHRRALIEPWGKIAKHVAVWDYWRQYVGNFFDGNTRGFYAPLVNIRCLRPDLEYFQANHVRALFLDCNDWYRQYWTGLEKSDSSYGDDVQSFQPLRVWLGLKLTHDLKRDQQELLEVFFAGYYGPAAGKMRELLAYIEKRQDECGPKLNTAFLDKGRDSYYQAHLDLDFFIMARKLLAEAEALAADPRHRAHVSRERIPVDSALLHLEPSLRRTYCGQGQRTWPFDRVQVLAGYEDAFKRYLEINAAGKFKEAVRARIEQRLAYLRTMAMISPDSLRYRAAPAAAVTLDGVLNEPVWQTAEPLSLTPISKGAATKARTTVRLLWSESRLYVACECFEDRIKDMQFEPRKQDDTEIWRESSVEVFLNPSGDRKNYFQLMINPAGALADIAYVSYDVAAKSDKSWQSQAEIGVRINADSWVLELAIPFEALKFKAEKGAALVANVGRSRVLKPDGKESADQRSSLSPLLTGHFHDLEKFGTVILTGEEVLLSSFEGPRDTPAMTPKTCGVAVVAENATEGRSALCLTLAKGKPEADQGVTFKAGELSDWSKFAELRADIFVDGQDELKWSVRIESDRLREGFSPTGNSALDQAAKRRFYYYGNPKLKPGWNKNFILAYLTSMPGTPRADSYLDLSAVNNFYFFSYGQEKEGVRIFLDNIRLGRKKTELKGALK
jgi:hypothetical protein